jgi:hypothetical protein
MTPIDEQSRETWYKFREYVNKEMKHAPSNAQHKLNGAGAFVDFLSGRKPRKNTQYAKHQKGKWPTG